MSAEETLKTCFRETFALEAEPDWSSLRYQGIPAWDSVGHMQLVAAIETAFDIMFDTEQVLAMSDFAKAAEICRSHGVAFEAT